MPRNFKGWPAHVVSVDKLRDDGLHVNVAFEVRRLVAHILHAALAVRAAACSEAN